MLTNTPWHARLREETRYKNMEQKKIDRINELAKKQKTAGLSEEEKTEQAILRKEYIVAYKRSLVSQLENLYFVEPDGTKTKVVPKDRNKKQ